MENNGVVLGVPQNRRQKKKKNQSVSDPTAQGEEKDDKKAQTVGLPGFTVKTT